jgi:hypothetical protein
MSTMEMPEQEKAHFEFLSTEIARLTAELESIGSEIISLNRRREETIQRRALVLGEYANLKGKLEKEAVHYAGIRIA